MEVSLLEVHKAIIFPNYLEFKKKEKSNNGGISWIDKRFNPKA